MLLSYVKVDYLLILDVSLVIIFILMPYVFIRFLLPDFKLLFGITSTRYRGILRKRFLGDYSYHNYYLTEKSLKTDKNAQKIASVLHAGYVNSWFDDYYYNLSEEHLPIHVFVNWTRTIVEDLMSSVNPINHVQGWDNYLHNMDSLKAILQPKSIIFEDYELAYLWGGVYYWLKCFVTNLNNDDLLHQIEKVACRKKYLTPYFLLFKNMADGVENTFSLDFVMTGNPPSEKHITSEQTALLWLAIAKLSEGDVKNKKKLAPIIHQLTGVGEKSLELKICGIFKDEDKSVLTNIIGEQLPNLADKIRNIEKSNPLP